MVWTDGSVINDSEMLLIFLEAEYELKSVPDKSLFRIKS